MTEAWPLSAAATRVLRAPKVDATEVLKLGLKELVLRGGWTIERQERQGALGRRREELFLAPGDAAAPALPPLPRLDAALRAAWRPDRTKLTAVVRKLPSSLAGELRDDAREELAARGLVERERRRALGVVPRTVFSLTPSGETWQQGSYEREERIETAVRSGRGPGLGTQAAALGGMVLLLSPAPLAELDGALQRWREEYAGGGASAGAPAEGDVPDVDLGDLGALDLSILDTIGGLDTTFDTAFDSAVDAGGGGGDGGGGGGDGGGGGS